MDNFLIGLKALVGNYIFISAIAAWFVAQIIKIFTKSLTKKKSALHSFVFSTGGMPSSHSATVMGLTTASMIQYGFESPIFAICAVVAIIVMTDAFGVRYETGKQSKMLNILMKKETGESENEEDIKNTNTEGTDEASNKTKKKISLNEFVGHTPLQVVVGALVGVAVGIALAFVY